MAAPQGGMVPKGLAQGQQGGELMGNSWKEHAVQKLEEQDGKGWKRKKYERIPK